MVSNVNSITISNTTYQENDELENINLRNVPWSNNSMEGAFTNCYNLTRIGFINNNVTNMHGAFTNCYNLVNITPSLPSSVSDVSEAFRGTSLTDVSFPNTVTNMYGAFVFSNVSGDIYIKSENVSNAIDIFSYTTSNEKNVYIPFNYTNGDSTLTYNSFINAGFSPSTPRDNALLFDINDPIYDWYYDTLKDGTKLLYKYNGEDVNIVVPSVNTMINSYVSDESFEMMPFVYSNFISVDLANVPFANNSMQLAFLFSRNIQTVTNINTDVESMNETFEACDNLTDAPIIPNSVIDMGYTFCDCTNLVNASPIPNSVENMGLTFWNCSNLVNAPDMSNATNITNMERTFAWCTNLVNAPDMSNATNITRMVETFVDCSSLIEMPIIPNNVTDMSWTFAGCSNLVNTTTIPSSVGSMQGTFFNCSNLVTAPEIPASVYQTSDIFSNCVNLTGTINIYSEAIWDISGMFEGTTLDKNVYIPFNRNQTYYAWEGVHETLPINECYTDSNLYAIHGAIPSLRGIKVYYANGVENPNYTAAYYSWTQDDVLHEEVEISGLDSLYVVDRNSSLDVTFQVPSQTYTTFINEGYSDSVRANDGVLLFDINEVEPTPEPQDVDLTGYNYNKDSNNDVIIERYTGNEQYVTTPHMI